VVIGLIAEYPLKKRFLAFSDARMQQAKRSIHLVGVPWKCLSQMQSPLVKLLGPAGCK
jgi:hypothetical protein